jgi:hypothetical protein
VRHCSLTLRFSFRWRGFWLAAVAVALCVSPRAQASALYETIEAAESIDESGLPDQAYVVPEGTLGGTAPLNPTTGSAASVPPPATTTTGGNPQSQQIFDATGAH